METGLGQSESSSLNGGRAVPIAVRRIEDERVLQGCEQSNTITVTVSTHSLIISYLYSLGEKSHVILSAGLKLQLRSFEFSTSLLHSEVKQIQIEHGTINVFRPSMNLR